MRLSYVAALFMAAGALLASNVADAQMRRGRPAVKKQNCTNLNTRARFQQAFEGGIAICKAPSGKHYAQSRGGSMGFGRRLNAGDGDLNNGRCKLEVCPQLCPNNPCYADKRFKPRFRPAGAVAGLLAG